MNKIILTGRLTRDSELRYTKTGKPVINFTIAVNDGYGEKQTTDFINIVAFSIENLATYLLKGTHVLVNGRLKIEKYEKDGEQRSITKIYADTFRGIELLSNSSKNREPFDIIENENDNDKKDMYNDLIPVHDEDVPF